MMKDSVQKGMKSSKKEEETKTTPEDNNSGEMKTFLESNEIKEINKIHDIPGKELL